MATGEEPGAGSFTVYAFAGKNNPAVGSAVFRTENGSMDTGKNKNLSGELSGMEEIPGISTKLLAICSPIRYNKYVQKKKVFWRYMQRFVEIHAEIDKSTDRYLEKYEQMLGKILTDI